MIPAKELIEYRFQGVYVHLKNITISFKMELPRPMIASPVQALDVSIVLGRISAPLVTAAIEIKTVPVQMDLSIYIRQEIFQHTIV